MCCFDEERVLVSVFGVVVVGQKCRNFERYRVLCPARLVLLELFRNVFLLCQLHLAYLYPLGRREQ